MILHILEIFKCFGGFCAEKVDFLWNQQAPLSARSTPIVLSNKKTDLFSLPRLVLVVGVEPTRTFILGILSPVRLPFRHTSIFN